MHTSGPLILSGVFLTNEINVAMLTAPEGSIEISGILVTIKHIDFKISFSETIMVLSTVCFKISQLF